MGRRATDQKYPANNLSSRAIKEALLHHLIIPTMHLTNTVYAFRLVWRHEEEDPNESSWLAVVPNRIRCDDIIQQIPGVEYAVSAVTAIFNKPSRKGQVPKCIFPAIAYWMVVDEKSFKLDEFYSIMQQACPFATIRVVGGTSPIDSMESICASLHIVLKDHSSGYIRQRMCSSTMAANLEPEARGTHTSCRILLCNKEKYGPVVLGALPALIASKLVFDTDDFMGGSMSQ